MLPDFKKDHCFILYIYYILYLIYFIFNITHFSFKFDIFKYIILLYYILLDYAYCIYVKYKLVSNLILNSTECLKNVQIHSNSAKKRSSIAFSNKHVHTSICLNRPVLSLAIRSFHLAVSFVLDDYGRSESECARFVFLYRRSRSPGNPGLDLPRSVTVDPVWYFTYCTSRVHRAFATESCATMSSFSIIDFDKPLIIAFAPSKMHSRWHAAIWEDDVASASMLCRWLCRIRSLFSLSWKHSIMVPNI